MPLFAIYGLKQTEQTAELIADHEDGDEHMRDGMNYLVLPATELVRFRSIRRNGAASVGNTEKKMEVCFY